MVTPSLAIEEEEVVGEGEGDDRVNAQGAVDLLTVASLHWMLL